MSVLIRLLLVALENLPMANDNQMNLLLDKLQKYANLLLRPMKLIALI